VGDRVLMLENSWYSVISPESCSSILWRSWEYKEQAAEALQLTAPDLKKQGLIDAIVPEPLGGAHRDHEQMAKILKEALLHEIGALLKLKPERLVERRIEKFSKMGVWTG
jgi:acetyl-CoA carboxylase carboxyl transferase subunit alpha